MAEDLAAPLNVQDGQAETTDDRLARIETLLTHLLALVEHAAPAKVDRGGVAKVEPAKPTPEHFAELRAKRRRKAHRHG